MSSLAILVPVLDRPQRIAPLLKSARRSTPSATVLFICDPDDDAEKAAIEVEGGECISPGGGYAAKIRAGIEETTESLIFAGADDLEFRPGWFEKARACLKDGIEVVGVNDLLTRSREHAPHFLMTRAYALRPTIDNQPGPFWQGYSHWFCDDELIATAKHRGAYAYCEEAVVKHLHHMNGGAPDDETYRKGREKAYLDRRLFRRRERLWT